MLRKILVLLLIPVISFAQTTTQPAPDPATTAATSAAADPNFNQTLSQEEATTAGTGTKGDVTGAVGSANTTAGTQTLQTYKAPSVKQSADSAKSNNQAGAVVAGAVQVVMMGVAAFYGNIC
ncbi:MAG: hypothetical protein V4736_06650, partial [Bdellovibrionota bacterium]